MEEKISVSSSSGFWSFASESPWLALFTTGAAGVFLLLGYGYKAGWFQKSKRSGLKEVKEGTVDVAGHKEVIHFAEKQVMEEPNIISSVNTLVFEGGSVKGLAYVGALQTLELYSQNKRQKPFLGEDIKRVAGTSAGSIIALLIALGLNLDQIKIVMQNTSFSSFADSKWYAYGNAGKGAAVYNNGYLCEGLIFMEWVEGLLETYAKNKAITFQELKKLKEKDPNVKDLHVYAVRLNDSEVVEFSADKTPTVSVALAIRMSMSIPVFFKPVRVNETRETGKVVIRLDEEKGDTYYVDGGVKMNYPYPLIKGNGELNLKDENILGFKVDSDIEILKHVTAQERGKYLTPVYTDRTKLSGGYGIHLMPHILTALMSPQEDSHNKNPEESKRTIRCWDCNISTFDFDLNQQKVDALLASGMKAAQEFVQLASVNLDDQINVAHAVPQREEAFATAYAEKEQTRVNEVAETVAKAVKDSEVTATNPEVKMYIQKLEEDVERLNKNYRLIQRLEIEGSVTQEAVVRMGNVTNLQPGLEALKEATRHIEEMTKLGMHGELKVAKGATVSVARMEAGNLDFSSEKAPEDPDILRRLGLFSPESSATFSRRLLQTAEVFLKGTRENTVYGSNGYIRDSCAELEEKIEECKQKGIKNVSKTERGEIRDKISEIEGLKRKVDETKAQAPKK